MGRTFQNPAPTGRKRHAFDRYGCGSSNVYTHGFRLSGQSNIIGKKYFPYLASKDPEDRPDFKNGGGIVINGNMAGKNGIAVSGAEARRIAGIPSNIEVSEEDTQNLSNSIQKLSAAADQISRMAELTDATQKYLDQMAAISEQMIQFRQATQSLTDVSNLLLDSYRNITDNSDGITNNTQGYVEQMESLNRNIAGLNTIYEIQLKSISSQL